MQNDFKKLITWSQQFDHLPWRQNRSLYRTLVSEIMLQQTTVSTVINKFEGFLSAYPSIAQLAEASEEQILIAWKGLGYYRRAKNLLAAAKYIKAEYAADLPTSFSELITIPGIGEYTASAILAIGAQQKSLAIDTNLERVLARYYGLDQEKGPKLKKTILQLFENKEILNFDLCFRSLNEALMDLGREICTTSKANCNSCPLQSGCQSKTNPLARPIIKKGLRVSHELSLLRVLIIENNHLLSYKKAADEWLTGQWECPTFNVNSSVDVAQYPSLIFNYQHLPCYKTTITKYKISNYILHLSLTEFNNLFNWTRELHPILISSSSNFSTATLKALKSNSLVKEPKHVKVEDINC